MKVGTSHGIQRGLMSCSANGGHPREKPRLGSLTCIWCVHLPDSVFTWLEVHVCGRVCVCVCACCRGLKLTLFSSVTLYLLRQGFLPNLEFANSS